MLIHYNPSLPFRLAGDASTYGIGAVLSHVLPDGTKQPVAFASRTLSLSEKNYAQVEKEALSLVFGVKRFHTYFYGRSFTLVIDHKPLTTILGPKKGIPPLAAARLQRWAILLAAYHYDIEFRPTGAHANADGLSRLPLNMVTAEGYSSDHGCFQLSQLDRLPVTALQLKAATTTCPELSPMIRWVEGGWPQKVEPRFSCYWNHREELTVEAGCLLWGMRAVIPEKLRQKLLAQLHLDHPGTTRMKMIARGYFWWPELDRDIESMVRSCLPCQSVKRVSPVATLHSWTWPTRPWQRVHLDFAGPFQGFMFFVIVDARSKWPEVLIMTQTTVSKTISLL